MQVNFCYNKHCHYKNHLSITVISKLLSIAHLFQAVVIATKLEPNKKKLDPHYKLGVTQLNP